MKQKLPENFPKRQIPKNSTPQKQFFWAVVYLFILLILFFPYLPGLNSSVKEISWQQFENEIISRNAVEKINIINKEEVEVFIKADMANDQYFKDVFESGIGRKINPGPHYRFSIGSIETFERRLDEAQKNKPIAQKIPVTYSNTSNWFWNVLGWILPVFLIFYLWRIMFRRYAGMGSASAGNSVFNFGKSNALMVEKEESRITFDDVAGLEEAEMEVKEIVDFLKNPQKYTALGGKIPKGALLVGPPGTGKTLLAKAMAGEAQVPFFSMSGSDFVELFVGVGASRVRDLFKQAREKAPCIIFIDEIDAIGRARGKNAMMSNDERENTLNQLLVEMDGFGGDTGIIILAATNRPDVLDSALLRPGRFDRQISIDKPDVKGREEIFKVHLEPIKISEALDLHKLAEQTPGFAGADIANVCNEAALIAARKGKESVEMIDFQDAIDRVIGGLEKKNKIIAPHEKSIIAYHEAGHAVCGWFLEHAYPLLKVTIVPRGTAALGYAQYTPTEQYLYNTDQLMDQICMTLGGRAAEEIFFGKISTGASNDLQQITRIAYSMVTAYGMNSKVGNVSYYDPSQENTFTKPYSEETGKIIDHEVRGIIEEAYQRTLQLLRDKKEAVEILAKELLAKEVLHKSDVEVLIGKRPFEEKKVVEVEVVPDEQAAPEAPAASDDQTSTEESI